MSETEPDVGRRTAIGAAWTVALRFSVRGIGLVSTVILARLLVPGDFGLVGLAMMLQGILEIMGRFGFDLALIRDRDAGRKHYDTTWTLTLIRNGLVAAPDVRRGRRKDPCGSTLGHRDIQEKRGSREGPSIPGDPQGNAATDARRRDEVVYCVASQLR